MHTTNDAGTAPFSITLFARWADMDFNQHMKNAAYLGASEDCRMQFLAAHGFPIEAFQARQLGPVVVEDKLTYRAELRLLEPFTVSLALAATTADGRRMKARNTITRADGSVAASVESTVLWFDLARRVPIAPPADLLAVWMKLARSDDFETWPEKRSQSSLA